MKALITAIALMSAAFTAQAESFELHSHGNWTVDYLPSNEGGHQTCLMTSKGYSNGAVSFKFAEDSIWLDIYSPNGRRGAASYNGYIDIWVDADDYARISAENIGKYVQASPSPDWFLQFVKRFSEGNILRVDTDDSGKSDLNVSLAGSKAAFIAWVSCWEKVRGESL